MRARWMMHAVPQHIMKSCVNGQYYYRTATKIYLEIGRVAFFALKISGSPRPALFPGKEAFLPGSWATSG